MAIWFRPNALFIRQLSTPENFSFDSPGHAGHLLHRLCCVLHTAACRASYDNRQVLKKERQSLTNFEALGLAAPILAALKREGYSTPTPIQAKGIPAVLAGSDLLGIAQTGTGKTAAFALPILHRLKANPQAPLRKGCRVLVLTPTRELAAQIAQSFRTYGKDLGLSVSVVVGGAPPRKQIRDLAKGVDILIATPGRLLDHVGENHIILKGTEVLVLDEADQMLDLGFLKPIQRIVSGIPTRRQTLFFSATMPTQIAGLARAFLRDPVRVTVAPVATTAEHVAQRVIYIERSRKRAVLTELFADPQLGRVIVFTRTKRGADRVARQLDTAGFKVAAIHGNKSQGQRERALNTFRNGKLRILVATDIAARGIDIDDVSHVINFELPDTPDAYVHRIGRTGRAGASGCAISLCDTEERGLLTAIERLTRQSIPKENRCTEAATLAEKNNQKKYAASSQRSHTRRPGSQEKARPKRHKARPVGKTRGGKRGAKSNRLKSESMVGV